MKLLLVVIALATVPVYEVGAVLKDGRYNPFIPGDLPVNHTSFLSPLTLFLDTNLDVYAPNAPGAYPLFYLITGLGGKKIILSSKQLTMNLFNRNRTIWFLLGIAEPDSLSWLRRGRSLAVGQSH